MGGTRARREAPSRTRERGAREGPVCPPGQPGGPRRSIPAEAFGRLDRLEFAEVEIDDGLQGFGGGAVLKAAGQGLEPRPILLLKSEQDGDGIVPAPGPSAVMGRAP